MTMPAPPDFATPSPTAPAVGGEMMPVAQRLAQAISLGLVQAPTNPGQWAQLADTYTAPVDPNAMTTTPTQGQPTQPTTSGNNGDLNTFLSALRAQESGGNYGITNSIGASGAYQFMPSTWTSNARAAGYGQWANGPASAAPPAVQDAVAAHMAQGYYDQFGNWQDVAKSWYAGGGFARDNQTATQAGGAPSIDQYAASVMNHMNRVNPQSPTTPLGASSAVSWAMGQIGTPYVWGGEQPGSPGHPGAFDCSGLVQATYKAIGVNLPRVAQQQYDATAKVPQGQPLQPGDLVFFGQGPRNITHVGIYIGNNQMVDAPHAGASVRVENYQWADYVGATRPSDPTGQSTVVPNTASAAQGQANISTYYQTLNQVVQALSSLSAPAGGQP